MFHVYDHAFHCWFGEASSGHKSCFLCLEEAEYLTHLYPGTEVVASWDL